MAKTATRGTRMAGPYKIVLLAGTALGLWMPHASAQTPRAGETKPGSAIETVIVTAQKVRTNLQKNADCHNRAVGRDARSSQHRLAARPG